MEYFSVNYSWSRLEHTYALGSKIGGIITFCILLLVAAVVFWRNTLERERLRALLFSNGSSPFRVIWHQGKEEGDDVVQLVNPDEDTASEEEGEYLIPLPALTPTPVVHGPESTPLPSKNISEGLPAIELKMIE
ncbi:hypothetical protein OESDEN_16200 [Oesophagostomum dentatum]|uniref:Uncharacterized protein n=1 Tax=Oesophagostomum dentatum TaxID=61180 RepID=A0A0B1SLL9_OESDE|nr:hypothetical protein OESDEN_16200 [Oesophagostomum dentatum]